jgi:hypothetical protein
VGARSLAVRRFGRRVTLPCTCHQTRGHAQATPRAFRTHAVTAEDPTAPLSGDTEIARMAGQEWVHVNGCARERLQPRIDRAQQAHRVFASIPLGRMWV